MTKEELKEKLGKLNRDGQISFLSFPAITEPTILIALVGSNEADEKNIRELIDSQDLENWKVFYLRKTADMPENLKFPNCYRVDFVSDEYLNGWKRAKADLINYKKEEAERFEAFAKFSAESLIAELLAIVDSFDLGRAAVQGDKRAEEGFRVIRAQLEDILKRRGLTAILAPPGTPFNPLCHEGVGEVESPYPLGTVAEEVSRGYALGGRVLRPARVKVSKGQPITDNK